MCSYRRPPDPSAEEVGSAVEEQLHLLSVGDRDAAVAHALELLHDGWTPTTVLVDVVAGAQRRIGELWSLAQWSVAQEHAGTAISEAVVMAVGFQVPPPPAGAPRVVVACAAYEWHALAARLVAETLRAAGWAVSYLGPSITPSQLAGHVATTSELRAVAVSCSMVGCLPRVRQVVEAVRATGVPVLVGGRAFDPAGRRARLLGADGFAVTARDAAAVLDRLPRTTLPAEPLTHSGAAEVPALLRGRSAAVAAVTARALAAGGLAHPGTAAWVDEPWVEALDSVVPHLVGAIAGALVVDDAQLMTEAWEWVEVVLRSRDTPAAVLPALHDGLADAVTASPCAARLAATVLVRS